MNIRTIMGLAACVALLAGCATRPPSPLAYKQEVLTATPTKVGVAMTAIPKIDTSFPGAACLLCYAAASVANSSLTTYTHTLSYEDLPKLKDQVAEVLSKKGIATVIIKEDLDVASLPDGSGPVGPNMARKNFTSLKDKYGVDKLLVIAIDNIGFSRMYSSYIPNSDPRAQITGTAYIVDLKTNQYNWYNPVSQTRASQGAWDEPPKFPGLTNAYYQVLELAKDSVLNPLSK